MSRWLMSTMAVALFVALVVAASGFEALFSGQDPIRQDNATPYLGPAMVASVAAVVFFSIAVGARRGGPVASALVAAAAGYLTMLVVGSLGYTIVTGDVAALVVFPAGYALGPFVVGTVIIAFLVVLGAIAALQYQRRSEPHPNPADRSQVHHR